MTGVVVGRDRADLGDLFLLRDGRESLVVSSSTAASTALSIPRRDAVGLAPEVMIRSPSRKIARARMVAVVVPSPATSDVFDATTLTSLAPMFSNGSWQLDFLRDGDAVLGDRRPAERLAQDHVAAGRAERGAHGVGQDIDAFQHLAAGGVGEKQLLGHGVELLIGLSAELRSAEVAKLKAERPRRDRSLSYPLAR